jgi:hypothetical protein
LRDATDVGTVRPPSKGDRMDLTLNIEIPPFELTEDEILTDLSYGR